CSLALDYALGGLEPPRYHATNLAIHLSCGLVLFALLRRILRLHTLDDWRDLGDPVAAITAVLWVLHPLGTQAVTYIVQRAESLVALFYLLTLYAALRGIQEERTIWKVLAVVACLLGMCTKPVMVTAPLVVLLLD